MLAKEMLEILETSGDADYWHDSASMLVIDNFMPNLKKDDWIYILNNCQSWSEQVQLKLVSVLPWGTFASSMSEAVVPVWGFGREPILLKEIVC